MKVHHDVLAYEGKRIWRFIQVVPAGYHYNGPASHRVTPLHEEGDPMCFIPPSMSDVADTHDVD